MMKVLTAAAIAGLALTVTVAPQPAFARNGGAIAAGVVGGLAVGAIIGSQGNGGYYGGPAYYQEPYQPVYRNCRYEREQVEDNYGRIRMRRIRVCD